MPLPAQEPHSAADKAQGPHMPGASLSAGHLHTAGGREDPSPGHSLGSPLSNHEWCPAVSLGLLTHQAA